MSEGPINRLSLLTASAETAAASSAELNLLTNVVLGQNNALATLRTQQEQIASMEQKFEESVQDLVGAEKTPTCRLFKDPGEITNEDSCQAACAKDPQMSG